MSQRPVFFYPERPLPARVGGVLSLLPTPTMPAVSPVPKSVYDHGIGKLTEKPWLQPGADMSDYFNYGFTEETWKLYCERQSQMYREASGLANIRTQADSPPRPAQQTTSRTLQVPHPQSAQPAIGTPQLAHRMPISGTIHPGYLPPCPYGFPSGAPFIPPGAIHAPVNGSPSMFYFMGMPHGMPPSGYVPIGFSPREIPFGVAPPGSAVPVAIQRAYRSASSAAQNPYTHDAPLILQREVGWRPRAATKYKKETTTSDLSQGGPSTKKRTAGTNQMRVPGNISSFDHLEHWRGYEESEIRREERKQEIEIVRDRDFSRSVRSSSEIDEDHKRRRR